HAALAQGGEGVAAGAAEGELDQLLRLALVSGLAEVGVEDEFAVEVLQADLDPVLGEPGLVLGIHLGQVDDLGQPVGRQVNSGFHWPSSLGSSGRALTSGSLGRPMSAGMVARYGSSWSSEATHLASACSIAWCRLDGALSGGQWIRAELPWPAG